MPIMAAVVSMFSLLARTKATRALAVSSGVQLSMPASAFTTLSRPSRSMRSFAWRTMASLVIVS